MFSPRSPDDHSRARLTLAHHRFDPIGVTQVRVHLQIPSHYHQEPVLSRLISDYGLVVNITGAMLGETTARHGWFDLELRGTAQQLKQGLAYLESLGLKIVGKPGTAGDSWYY